MKLIKLYFIGFVDEGSPNTGSYIDTVIYEPLYVRADKILAIKNYIADVDGCYPIPTLTDDLIEESKGTWSVDMVVDNFAVEDGKDIDREFNIKKQSSIVYFDEDYSQVLRDTLCCANYQYNPCFEDGAFVIYESPAEISAMAG